MGLYESCAGAGVGLGYAAIRHIDNGNRRKFQQVDQSLRTCNRAKNSEHFFRRGTEGAMTGDTAAAGLQSDGPNSALTIGVYRSDIDNSID